MSNTALSVGLIIGAALSSGFGSAIGSATTKISQLQKKGESFKIGEAAGKQFQELRSESHKVWEEYNATGRSSAELRTRLISLRQSTAAARQEAERYGINIKNVAEQTKHLGTMSAVTEARLGRMQANMARKQARGALRSDLLGVAAVATFTLGFPIKAAMGFEAQMNRVGAITKADAAQMDALRNNAREMGRSTQFTASQAASAQEYLGMAGYKTNEIIAAMPGNLALAAAGQLDLARTADISSNILSGFGLEAKEANRVADVMAETATSSNTNIEQMGDSMKYAAPLANVLGVSLEQTAAMVGLMGNAGIQGSMAGTALRSAFSRLAKPPKEAAAALERLNVRITDSQGNMRPMPKILKEIGQATKNMGSAERAAAYGAIFGQEAVSGMATVIDGAVNGSLDVFINKLNGCDGAAERMAKKMNEGARGALVRLGSAAESVAIDVGDVLLPTIAEWADKLGSVTSKVSDFAQKNPLITKAVVGLTVGLLGMNVAAKAGALGWNYLASGTNVLIDGLSYLRPSTIQASLALMKMKGSGSIVGGVISMLKGNIFGFGKTVLSEMKIAALGVKALGSAILTTPIGWFLLAAVAIGTAAYFVWKNWDTVKAHLIKFWDYVKTTWSSIGEAIKTPFIAPIQWIGDKIDWLSQKWEGIKSVLGGSASTPTTKAGKPVPMPGHALGGIFDKPHIAAISEGSKKEAVIPLEGNSDRARSIYAAAGQHLGIRQQAAGVTINANININVPFGSNAANIAQEVLKVLRDLERKARSRERGRFADAPLLG